VILADFTVDCTSYEESALTLLIAYNIFFVFFSRQDAGAGVRRFNSVSMTQNGDFEDLTPLG